MEALGKSTFQVIYNNKDISKDISQYLLSIKYNDKTENNADELSISLENVDALWENDWYPEKGTTLSAKIGDGNLTLDCGSFEIDEIEISSPPDIVTIRAISAPISGGLRTSKSIAHEKTSLKQIIEKVAADNHLKVNGTIRDLNFERITQNREADLSFLKRLGEKFGFYFSIRGDQLIFTDAVQLLGAASVTTIDRTDCESYSIKDKSAKVFRKANIGSYNPNKKQAAVNIYSSSDAVAPDGSTYPVINENPASQFEANSIYSDIGAEFDTPPTGDDLNDFPDIENDSQADAYGKAALIGNNTLQQGGNLTLVGNPLLVAGVNFQFTGIGKLSGKYHISESDHSSEKESGYKTTLTIKRVGFIEISKHKRKTVTKKGTYDVKVIK